MLEIMNYRHFLLLLLGAVAVQAETLQVTATNSSETCIQYSSDPGSVEITLDGVVVTSAPLSSVTRIEYVGSAFDDVVMNQTDIPLEADGGAGDDKLFGGTGNDVLYGAAGMDLVVGYDGDDFLNGGSSDDVLIGGMGTDSLNGRGDDDLIISGATVYDRREELDVLYSVWTNAMLTYSNKVAALSVGTNGVHLSHEAGVLIDDGVEESQITGHTGDDWFVVAYGDPIDDVEISEQQLLPWFKTVSGGVPLCSDRWFDNLNIGGSEASHALTDMVEVSGMPFSSAYQVTAVMDENPSPNDLLINVKSSGTTQSNELVVLSFFYRSTRVSPNPNEMAVRFDWQTSSNSNIIDRFYMQTSPQWQQFVTTAYMPDQRGDFLIDFTFGIGDAPQTLEIGGVEMVAYDPALFSVGEISRPDALNDPHEEFMGTPTNILIAVLENDRAAMHIATQDTYRVTSIVSLPERGTVSIVGDKVEYTPDSDYFGKDSFEYAMVDQYGKAASARVNLLYRHNFNDGTWYVGDDPLMGTPARKQAVPLADEYNAPYGSWKIHGAMSSVQAAMVQNDPAVMNHKLCFAKLRPDGSKGLPTGWTWQLEPGLGDNNWGYTGIALRSNDEDLELWKGFNANDIVEWNFHFDVEAQILSYERGILINTYWYSHPTDREFPDGSSRKTMDLGLFFVSPEKDGWPDENDPLVYEVEIDGLTCLFNEAILRFYIDIKTYEHFSMDIDMAPFVRFVIDNGYATQRDIWINGGGTAYWHGGAFDMEIKNKPQPDYPDNQAVGEVIVNEFEYEVGLDLPAVNPLEGRLYPVGSGLHTISLTNVFESMGSPAKVLNEVSGTYSNVPASLVYSVSGNSNTGLLSAAVVDDELLLSLNPGMDGVVEITIRADDHFNRWYDEETFEVTVKDMETYWHWDFNESSGETVFDVSTNHMNGVLSGAVREDGYLKFEADGYVEFPTDVFESYIYKEITVACRVHSDSSNMVNDTLFQAHDGNERVASAHLPWSTGKIYFDAGNNGKSFDRIVKDAVAQDYHGWHHWAFVKNAMSGDMQIYRDGELWYAETGKTNMMRGVNSFMLGGEFGGRRFFAGLVDDFMVFNRALSGNEVQQLADQDHDGDMMSDAWEYQWFGNVVDADAFTDHDGDHYLDRDEYIAGTDPGNAASLLKLNPIEWQDATNRVVEWAGVSNRFYRLLSKTNLVDGSWMIEQERIPGMELIRITNSTPAETLFWKVEVATETVEP